MKRCLFALTIVFAAFVDVCGTAPAHAAQTRAPRWTRCVYMRDNESVITSAACRSFAMPRHRGDRVTGHMRTTSRHGARETVTIFPTFYTAPKVPPSPPGIPAGYHLLGYFPITGYSWGCGTPNGITASGMIPQVGFAATGGSDDWLAFGTHIFVGGLGYSATVEDRGQGLGGFDLFAPSCTAAYAYTGSYPVYIQG